MPDDVELLTGNEEGYEGCNVVVPVETGVDDDGAPPKADESNDVDGIERAPRTEADCRAV